VATYTFRNTKTNEIEEHVMSISVYDKFKIDNPHLERYHDTAPIISFNGVGDNISRTDNTFKEVMSKIAEQNPRSPLADRFLRKDNKRIKTDATLEKHRKIQKEKRESARKRG
jgi:hypothetical protein